MEPIIELVVKGDDPEKIAAVACGKCRRVAPNEAFAKSCCVYTCQYCGSEAERYRTACDSCIMKRRAEEDRKRFEAAEKIRPEDYDFDHVSTTPFGGDGEYHSIDMIDDLALDHAYVWACVRQPWPQLYARDILDSALEGEYHESAIDQLDVEGLQKKLDEWLEQQGESRCFIADPKRVVILQPEECP